MAHQPTAATFNIMQDVEFQEKQFLKLEPQLCPLQGVLVGRQVNVAQRLAQRHEAVFGDRCISSGGNVSSMWFTAGVLNRLTTSLWIAREVNEWLRSTSVRLYTPCKPWFTISPLATSTSG